MGTLKSLLSEVDLRIPKGKFKIFYIEDLLGEGSEGGRWNDAEKWIALLVTDTNFSREELKEESDGFIVDRDEVIDSDSQLSAMDPEGPEFDGIVNDFSEMSNVVGDYIARKTGAKYYKDYRDFERAITALSKSIKRTVSK